MPQLSLIVCVPVKLVPNLPELALDSIYEPQDCPMCKEPMWVGERSKVYIQKHTSRLVCALCAVNKLGIDLKDTAMKKLSEMEEFNG